jgi:hypothetical protein
MEAQALNHTGSATLGEWRPSLLARCFNSVNDLLTAAALSTLAVVGIALPFGGFSPAYALIAIPVLPGVYYLCRNAINTWHARLTITTAEVVVAGVTRTHHVPLSEVDRFEACVQPGFGNGTPTIVLHRRGGPPIGIYAFNRQLGFVWNFEKIVHQLEPRAAELNRLIR